MIPIMRLALLLTVLSLIVVPAAEAKTLKVNWREYKGLPTGQFNFRVTKIITTATSWSVTATVANHSPYTLDVSRPKTTDSQPYPGTWTGRDSGFGIAFHVPPTNPGEIGGYDVRPNQHSLPALPSKLAPNATWTGTCTGKAKLPKRSELRVAFGFFTISAAPADRGTDVGQAFNWITDHTFRA
jgi:hypothetical protein